MLVKMITLSLVIPTFMFAVEQNGIDFTRHLPHDVLGVIVDHLLDPTEKKDSFNNLVTISQVNKKLNQFIRKDDRCSIQSLAKKMKMFPQGVLSWFIRSKRVPQSQLDSYLDKKLNQDLIKAVTDNDVNEVKRLLLLKADPNIIYNKQMIAGIYQYSLLIQAILNSNEAIINLLVAAGVDVNCLVNYRKLAPYPPLWLACNDNLFDKNAQKRIAKLFIEYEADINYKKYESDTLLWRCVKNNDVEFFKDVLSRNPNLLLTGMKKRNGVFVNEHQYAVAKGYMELADLIKTKFSLK